MLTDIFCLYMFDYVSLNTYWPQESEWFLKQLPGAHIFFQQTCCWTSHGFLQLLCSYHLIHLKTGPFCCCGVSLAVSHVQLWVYYELLCVNRTVTMVNAYAGIPLLLFTNTSFPCFGIIYTVHFTAVLLWHDIQQSSTFAKTWGSKDSKI